MGEVYRARATRLDRNVAIKVLPAAFRDRLTARIRNDRPTSFSRSSKPVPSLNARVGTAIGHAL